MNLWIVKAVLPEDGQLGAYAASSMIARVTFFPAMALTGGTFAWMVRAPRRDYNLPRICELAARLVGILAVFFVPMNLLVFLYGADILEAFC